MPRTHRSAINTANASRAADGFWTDARVEVLKAGWAARLSTATIAAQIGGGCTRNMVIGKANRLGLKPVSAARRKRISREIMKARWRENRPAMLKQSLRYIKRAQAWLARDRKRKEQQAIRVSRETSGQAA